MFESGSFHFAFETLQNLEICMVFSWYFAFPCQYPYTNTTYAHSDHRPHHIIPQFLCQYPYTNTTYTHSDHRPHHIIPQFPCQCLYTNTTYSHYNHTPHHIISQFYKVLTKISVNVSLNNISKKPSQQVAVLYTESYGLVSGLNSCTLLCG